MQLNPFLNAIDEAPEYKLLKDLASFHPAEQNDQLIYLPKENVFYYDQSCCRNINDYEAPIGIRTNELINLDYLRIFLHIECDEVRKTAVYTDVRVPYWPIKEQDAWVAAHEEFINTYESDYSDD